MPCLRSSFRVQRSSFDFTTSRQPVPVLFIAARSVASTIQMRNVINSTRIAAMFGLLLLSTLAVAAEPTPDGVRNPANVLFDKTGMFVNSAQAFPAERFASKMKMASVAWISLQIDNGGKVRQDNADAVEKGWADQWRTAGFKVGFWGCPRGVGEHGKQAARSTRRSRW